MLAGRAPRGAEETDTLVAYAAVARSCSKNEPVRATTNTQRVVTGRWPARPPVVATSLVALLTVTALASILVSGGRTDVVRSVRLQAAPPGTLARMRISALKLTCRASPTQRCGPLTAIGPGAWSWFADERAIHLSRDGFDEVIVGWVDPIGRIEIAAITASGHISTRVLARSQRDDHANPALSIEPNDEITAYWSGHNGQQMFYTTSLKPGDVSRWHRIRALGVNSPGRYGYTYPNPVILSAQRDRHYLFWRGGDWEPTVSTRAAAGVWGRAHVVIDVPGQRPYVKVATNGRDRIGLAFTDGHPDNALTSLYYIEIHGGALLTAAGTRVGTLGRALRPTAAERIEDAQLNGARTWVQDTAFDSHGHPVIVYSRYPPGTPAEYWYARRTGREWLRHRLAFTGASISASQPHYVGGIVLDHNRPDVIYLSRQVFGRYVIERWVTTDGGRTFSHRRMNFGPSDVLRPVLAQGQPGTGRPAAALFALRGTYNSYTDSHTSVVMLADGFRGALTDTSR